MSHAKRTPDFLVIGAMKCATTSVHNQMGLQPGIFVTAPKEPNFFSDDDKYARGPDWYCGLFRSAGPEDLVGESSTHYTKRPTLPETVQRMRCVIPSPRLIYVMRHPVDRLVSQYIHGWSQREIRCPIDEAIDRHPELVDYSRYAMQLEPYAEAFGRDAILPVFFERLKRAPQEELEHVCRFIGYEGEPLWRADVGPSNVSKGMIRRFPLYGLLVESAPAAFLRRHLVPKAWQEQVKRRLTTHERPELGAACRDALERELDRDLERLGEWLGLDLACATWDRVLEDPRPAWKDQT